MTRTHPVERKGWWKLRVVNELFIQMSLLFFLNTLVINCSSSGFLLRMPEIILYKIKHVNVCCVYVCIFNQICLSSLNYFIASNETSDSYQRVTEKIITVYFEKRIHLLRHKCFLPELLSRVHWTDTLMLTINNVTEWLEMSIFHWIMFQTLKLKFAEYVLACPVSILTQR